MDGSIADGGFDGSRAPGDGSTPWMDASDASSTGDPGDASVAVAPACEIGMPDAITGLAFSSVLEGGEVPLRGTGQTGLRVVLGVRVKGMGEDPVFTFTVMDAAEPVDPEQDAGAGGDDDAGVDPPGDPGSAVTSWQARSDVADCGMDGWCAWVPVVLTTDGLATPQELNCLEVEIQMDVDDGDKTCETSLRGVLARGSCL